MILSLFFYIRFFFLIWGELSLYIDIFIALFSYRYFCSCEEQQILQKLSRESRRDIWCLWNHIIVVNGWYLLTKFYILKPPGKFFQSQKQVLLRLFLEGILVYNSNNESQWEFPFLTSECQFQLSSPSNTFSLSTTLLSLFSDDYPSGLPFSSQKFLLGKVLGVSLFFVYFSSALTIFHV